MKKWTYLVVAGLLAGATPMLQSCVDNDEPEGINVLRKAKAELIAAKKIVQEAEAARLKAEAAKLEADAALVKAQAEIAKAAAELINAKTEGERADIEIRIAKAKAEAEHQQKVWEQEDKLAEVAYQTALAQLALVKAHLSVQQQNALRAYINDVDAKKAIYDEKMAAVRNAQRLWIKATEEVEYREENKDFYTFYLQQNLKREQAYVESLKSFIEEELNPEIAAAEAMTPGENVARRDELQAEYDALQAKIVEAQKAVDLARAEMAPDYDELNALQTAADAAARAEIEIPGFTYTFPELGLNLYHGEYTVYNDMTYTLSDQVNGWYTNYAIAKSQLESIANYLTRMSRDENGKAWTAEEVAVKKEEKEFTASVVEDITAWWQKIVGVYSTGKAYASLASLEEYDELLDLIAAYNATVEPYNTAIAEKNAFEALDDDASTVGSIRKKYADQEAAALAVKNQVTNTYNANIASARSAYLAEWGGFNGVGEAGTKWYDYQVLVAKTAEAQAYRDNLPATATAAEIAAAEAAITTARGNEAALLAAYRDATTTYNTKIANLNAKYRTDYALALAAYDVKMAEIAQARYNELTAYDATKAARQAEIDAAVNEARSTMIEALDEVNGAYSYIIGLATGDWNTTDLLTYGEVFEVPEDFDQVDKDLVKGQVEQWSAILYGYNFVQSENQFRLTPVTKEDIDEYIVKDCNEERPWEFVNHYDEFGWFGKLLKITAQIEAMEATLNLTDAQYAEMIKAVTDEEAALEATFEAAVAVAEEAQAAADEKEAEIDAALAELQAVVDELRTEARYLNEILLVYYQYSAGEYSQDQIDALVADLKEWKADLEEYLVELEYNVTVAEKNLADWNNNEIAAAETMKVALDEAQAAADVAKENLDIAQERLQKAIEAMAVSAE